MSTKPTYDVVSPTGKHIAETIRPAEPLSNVEGKTIGFVWGSFTNGDVLADALMGLWEKQFKGLKLIKLPSGRGLKWGDSPDNSVGSVAKEAGVDAVVVTAGC